MLSFSQCYIHSIWARGRNKQALGTNVCFCQETLLQFLNISFKNGSNFTFVSHEKPILKYVYKACDRVLGA